MRIYIRAYGIPKGQPRPRAFARDGKIRMREAGTAEAWKSDIANAAGIVRPEGPIAGPVVVNLTFYMPRPRGHFGTGKNAGILKASAPPCHVGKPDIDNLAKAVLDALTALGVWIDDTQIVGMEVKKVYADDEKPGAKIHILEVE